MRPRSPAFLWSSLLAVETVYYLHRFLENILPFAYEDMFLSPSYVNQIDIGLRLLHGLPHPVNISFYMPMQCVLSAWLWGLAPAALLVSMAALWLACVGGAWSLGYALFGRTAGLAAACAAIPLLPGAFGAGWMETFFFQAAVLLCARALVWDARTRSWASAALLGFAIDLSLLIRSTMFFLVPLRVLTRGLRWSSLLVALMPVLVLGPWIYMNWTVQGQFYPFESNRGDYNLIMAALGRVDNPPGENTDHAIKAGGLNHRESLHVLRWSVNYVLQHPMTYVVGCLKRLVYFAVLQPWLLLLAAAALWRHRRRPECAALAWFAAGFVALHCAISTEARYFLPLWPVLAALLPGLVWREQGPAAPGRPMFAAAALALPLALCTLLLVLRYPAATARPDAFQAEAARSTGDAWVLREAGRDALVMGDSCAAVSYLKDSLRLRQDDQARALKLQADKSCRALRR